MKVIVDGLEILIQEWKLQVNMAFTIDAESKQNINMPIDLSKMAPMYKCENGLFVFPSPSLWTIEKNLYFLMRNSIKKTFESKYKMRPDYLSYDEYNTVVLAPLLMRVNGVFAIEEFNLNEVIIPELSYIIEILSDQAKDKSINELDTVNW